ncbi:regulator of microtubule dynamics protein 1-like isoform X2 [Diabrotica virgifera virgifera]|uniref:Regulator of microtubule dynamics protein 1 n=1 Tax=Diabrotica virgifera virgifera TaxID=50390 RepID=A0ABM5JXI3_DIAVI|nr:regulator of microtubule dynamics protein 1-like isoform X2 [Diabrotica virgifera virgifera]
MTQLSVGHSYSKCINFRSNKSRRSKVRKARSIVSTSTGDGDEYLSSANLDSSDLEFYDLSDNENDNNSINMEEILNIIDVKLNSGVFKEVDEALIKLRDLCIEHPENSELLWRIGKAHKKIADFNDDKEVIKENVYNGIDACEASLRLKEDSSEAHKWFAILVGDRCSFGSISEKLADGALFKKHVLRALEIHPLDGTLHHLMGHFNYEAAGLKWYERKVASTFFGDPPSSTYPDALQNFLEAEKIVDYDWKSNKLMIAKCLIQSGEYKEAVEWLDKAKNSNNDGKPDEAADSEIQVLLEKYNSYR